MRVRMFKPQFAPMVLSGAKRQTMRPFPKRMPAIGDQESWRQWMGLPYRSKQLELAQVEIIGVQEVVVTERQIVIGTKSLSGPEEWDFARADGFNTPKDLFEWFNFTHGLPFSGILILAKDFEQKVTERTESAE